MSVGVPEKLLSEALDFGALLIELRGECRVPREAGDAGDSAGVGKHIAVDRGPDVLVRAGATNGLLHAVPDVELPEEAVSKPAFLLPAAIVMNQIVQEVRNKCAIAVHEIAIINGGRKPTAVFVKMRLRLPFISAQPEAGVVVQITGIPQPAAFGKVKAGGAANGVEDAGVLHWIEKFCHHETVGGLNNVFAKGPPAEIINFFKLFVGTFKEGNIALEPGKRTGVGNEIGNGFLLHRVEARDVRLEGGGFQNLEGLGGAGKNSKHQHPTSREDPNTKSQEQGTPMKQGG